MVATDEFLEHFGIRGQKWGVRKDRGHEGQQVSSRKLAKLDKKFERRAGDIKTVIAVHNKAAQISNEKDVPRINNKPQYKNKDFTRDTPLRQKYYKEHQQAFLNNVNKAAKDFGTNASGTKEYGILEGTSGDWRIVTKTVKHDDITDNIEFQVKVTYDSMGHIVSLKVIDDSLAQMDMVDSFLEHFGVKGQKWGVRNKRTASVDLTSDKTGESRKIYYNPKKLNVNGPTVGNKRQVSGSKREARNFQKQLTKASKELKPKAKDFSDEELRSAVNRMQMEKQYHTLTSGSSNKKGSDFVKTIGVTAVKTALTAVATQQVTTAFKKAKIMK